MNCPACQAPVGADQLFCRACGTVVGEPWIRPRVVNLGSLLLILLGGIVALGGWTVELRWLMYTGFYVIIAGCLGLLTVNRILEMYPRRAKPSQGEHPDARPTLESADTTNKLLPVAETDFVPPTVVDHTTELLKEPARKSR